MRSKLWFDDEIYNIKLSSVTTRKINKLTPLIVSLGKK
jgi:hypothetical protein